MINKRYYSFGRAFIANTNRARTRKVHEVISRVNTFILMHNFIAMTYQTGVLLSIVENKKKYKFCSGLCNDIIAMQNGYLQNIKSNTQDISNEAVEQVEDMSDKLQDGLEQEMRNLQIASDKFFHEKGCDDELISMLYVSYRLSMNATSTYLKQSKYMQSIDKDVCAAIRWMSFNRQVKMYGELIKRLKVEELFAAADDDPRIIEKWYNLMHKANDAEFIAHNMGVDITDEDELAYVNSLSQHSNYN